jgi:hypothetical protein
MALRRALTRQEADALAAKVVAMAKAGDATCLRLLFDRLDGPSSGPIAAIPLATGTAQQAQAEHDPFAGWTSEQLRDILAGLQQEGATIRKVDGNGGNPAPPALAAPARPAAPPAVLPAPAPKPTPPAPDKPAAMLASLSEVDAFGDAAQKLDQERERNAPRFRRPAAKRLLW